MADSTGSPAINEAVIVDVLMKEYLSARKEVLLHVQLYKTVPTRNAAILMAVVGLLIPLLTNQSITLPGGIMFHPTPRTDLVILFTISTIAFLLVFSVLSVLFALQILAERCVWLEDEINKSLRGPYLLWERFAHQIWSKDGVLVYKMPDAVAIALFYIIVLLFAVGLPLVVLTRNLCEAHSERFTIAAFFYAVYLLALPAISIYVNKHTMGTLRPYCRELLIQTRAGNTPSRNRSGLVILLVIVAVAAVAAYAFILVMSQPIVCKWIGA